MAQPIPLDIPTRPLHAELLERLDRAPEPHADALLAALDLLQLLHDRGVLDLVRGAISASDKISQQLTSAADSKESIRAFRNLILLGRMLSSVDPETTRKVASAVDATFGPNAPAHEEAPRLISLLGYLRHKYLRRSLAIGVRFLAALGRQLTPQTS